MTESIVIPMVSDQFYPTLPDLPTFSQTAYFVIIES